MKSKKERLDKIKSIVGQCDRCGACTTVCPLYQTDTKEKAVARGKIAITRAYLEGGMDPENKEFKHVLDYCLLCKACTEVCPSKIMTDEAMIEIRQHLAETTGQSIWYKMIGFVMGNNFMLKLSSIGMRIARALKLPNISGGQLPIDNSTKAYQKMQTGPGILSGSERSSAELKEIKKVGYFKGCAMKMFFPSASEDTIRLLRKQNLEVVIPDANCCGIPHLAHGMQEKAMELAAKNIDKFSDVELIITDCASCGSMLKEYTHRFKDNPELAQKAAAFSKKVVGLSEYLYQIGYKPEKKLDVKVSYHDSCHLNRGQKIKKEPRELLKMATNYVEIPHADRCCGGAGTFQYDFLAESQKVLQLKADSMKKTGARILVTECPSCMMQLVKAEKEGDFKVMHISQVL